MESAVKQNKALLTKYGACFGVASFITFCVFWIKGFFTDSLSVNIQILSDGFSISGMIFLFLAGMMYISGEGGLKLQCCLFHARDYTILERWEMPAIRIGEISTLNHQGLPAGFSKAKRGGAPRESP